MGTERDPIGGAGGTSGPPWRIRCGRAGGRSDPGHRAPCSGQNSSMRWHNNLHTYAPPVSERRALAYPAATTATHLSPAGVVRSRHRHGCETGNSAVTEAGLGALFRCSGRGPSAAPVEGSGVRQTPEPGLGRPTGRATTLTNSPNPARPLPTTARRPALPRLPRHLRDYGATPPGHDGPIRGCLVAAEPVDGGVAVLRGHPSAVGGDLASASTSAERPTKLRRCNTVGVGTALPGFRR